MKTIDELRVEFEEMAESKMFSIKRRTNGEYESMPTFLFWGGYCECAKAHGIIEDTPTFYKQIHALKQTD